MTSPKYATPAEYLAACEEAYSLCKMLPHPETIEQFLALDRVHPATWDRMGWADCVSAPMSWHAQRLPEPPRPMPPEPPPPQLDSDTKTKLINSLGQDEDFRQALAAWVKEGS